MLSSQGVPALPGLPFPPQNAATGLLVALEGFLARLAAVLLDTGRRMLYTVCMSDNTTFALIVILAISLSLSVGVIVSLADNYEECRGGLSPKDAKTPLGLFEWPQPYREPDRLAEATNALQSRG